MKTFNISLIIMKILETIHNGNSPYMSKKETIGNRFPEKQFSLMILINLYFNQELE